jgi:uncharacterized protein YPO0396
MSPSESSEPGFRLDRVELLNWGTFHGDVQTFEPSGAWALLVGDNGSGKSTAIDALRTLLVPPRMLNYNDAAGDGRRTGGRDRTRRSYVRGAWASSSTVDSTTPTTQYLREPGDLSAIAAVFTDRRRQTSVTVAQVLWEHEEQIREMYAVGTGRRGLGDLLAGYSNTSEIRRSARRAGWTVEDTFAAYAERMRELLHIPGDKALEVFNRAIGMKEVTDIDAFVRQFMLPSADTFGFIKDTVQPHYRTLLDCWGAIDKAERQVTLLRPVAERSARIDEGEQRIEGWRQLQEVAVPYFASRHLALLRETERELLGTIDAGEASRVGIETRLTDARGQRDSVRAAIASSDVGVRLQLLQQELDRAEQFRKQALQRRSRIEPAAKLLGALASLTDARAFGAGRQEWHERENAESVIASEADERRAAHRNEQEQALRIRIDKTEELESVERHRINIPRKFLAIRTQLAHAIGVAEEHMPFAGELMEVRAAYEEWTGAIERLLGGFGVALLVPENVYRPAAEFINSTPLGLRLTFHRVPVRQLPAPRLSPDHVPGRLEYRTDHPLHSWVANELVRRFNHRCCSSISELEATDRGLTREGLVRDGTRHVKDDARPVNDFSVRVLGWSTERKIAALKQQIADADRRAEAAGHAATEASKSAAIARDRAAAARELVAVVDFSEIDPNGWSREILRVRTEQEQLERSSDTVRTLKDRLRDLDETIRATDVELSDCAERLGRLRDRLDTCRSRASERERQLADAGGGFDDATETAFAEITANLPPLTLDNADQLKHLVHQRLGGRISNEQGKVNEASHGLIAGMSDFLNQFQEFKQTLQARREYADSFGAVLRRIEEEDLPRHRERFEQYLNENLVGDLLMLNRRLDEHVEAIEARIDETNEALRRIDYGDETYVQLRLNARLSQEATEFRKHLRDCFEHGIAPAPEERMIIFGRVRALLERFQSDPENTQRVTDVRTWYVSGVQELRRADDSEVNYYAATTGKSGGQKAKLAFTILASALSAQYGLSKSPSDSPNFRLVVIDEAFSRTDESNSTHAMQLFDQLGFQVVIVGPFDAKAKLAVPFVGTIHLASNPAGNSSRLMVLTREQAEASVPGGVSPEGTAVSTGSSSIAAV